MRWSGSLAPSAVYLQRAGGPRWPSRVPAARVPWTAMVMGSNLGFNNAVKLTVGFRSDLGLVSLGRSVSLPQGARGDMVGVLSGGGRTVSS